MKTAHVVIMMTESSFNVLFGDNGFASILTATINTIKTRGVLPFHHGLLCVLLVGQHQCTIEHCTGTEATQAV